MVSAAGLSLLEKLMNTSPAGPALATGADAAAAGAAGVGGSGGGGSTRTGAGWTGAETGAATAVGAARFDRQGGLPDRRGGPGPGE